MTKIAEVHEITDDLISAFKKLIPQLSSSAPPPGTEDLERIIQSPEATLFVAFDPEQQNKIIGTLTLMLYRIPTGLKAWIEDVVVDARARGRGVGEALCRAAIERAGSAGASKIDLTSSPSREAANRLYQRVGFVRRETNVYRYTIEK